MGSLRQSFIIAISLLLPSVSAFSQQLGAPAAHTVFAEGDASLERDGTIEPLGPGVPLVEGDRVRSANGRVEIDFENGSTLYLDQASTLDVLAADSLRLLAGALVFQISGNRSNVVPLYRIDTPAATFAIDAPGEYRVAAATEPPRTIAQVIRGTADLTSDNGGTTLRTGEQSTATAGQLPGVPVRFNSARWDAFQQWVEFRRNDRSVLSVSRQYLPSAIRSYAGTLDRYGTWITDAQYGVVWYPTIVGGWRPYQSGRWAWIAPFGWTWVGTEAWGWPTLHYGQWSLNPYGSWFWIPGNSWGTAAPIIGQFRADIHRGMPGNFPPYPRGRWWDDGIGNSGVMIHRGAGPPRAGSAGLQHDALARRPLSPMAQPSIGLPFSGTSLPPLRQGIMPSVPSVGVTPSQGAVGVWRGRAIQREVAPSVSTPPPQALPRSATSRSLGWPDTQAPAPRTAVPRGSPGMGIGPGPQLGTWGSIATPTPQTR